MDILLKKSYCDAISQERNKAYGQYELRVSYPKRIIKAQFIVLFILTCFVFVARLVTPEIKAIEDAVPVDPILFQNIKSTVLEIQLPKKPDAPAEKKPETKPPADTEVPKDIEHLRTPTIVQNAETKPIDSLATTSNPEGPNQVSNQILNVNSGSGGGETGTNPETGTGNTGSEYGTSEVVHEWAQIEPKFEGDLESFLLKSTHYPAKAISENIEGSVYILFVVDERGKVTQPSVLKGIGYGCDEEALRVVKTLPDFEPGKMNGKNVKVRMQVPFKFKLKPH